MLRFEPVTSCRQGVSLFEVRSLHVLSRVLQRHGLLHSLKPFTNLLENLAELLVTSLHESFDPSLALFTKSEHAVPLFKP